jgi:hypothetical protein
MFLNYFIKFLLLIKISFEINANKLHNKIILIVSFILPFLGFDCTALCESADSSFTEDTNHNYKKYLIIFFTGIMILGLFYYFNSPSVDPNLIPRISDSTVAVSTSRNINYNDFYANVNILNTIRESTVTINADSVYIHIDRYARAVYYCSMNFEEFCNIADKIDTVAILEISPHVAIQSHTTCNVISGSDMLSLIKEHGLTYR